MRSSTFYILQRGILVSFLYLDLERDAKMYEVNHTEGE